MRSIASEHDQPHLNIGRQRTGFDQTAQRFTRFRRFPGGGVVTIDAPLEQLPLFQRVAAA